MSNKEVANYVKNRIKNLRQQKFGDINLFIKDSMINNINIENVFEQIDYLLSYNILNLIDVVYIGDFDFLKEKNINAAYMNGAIYCSNEQDNEEDMIDDLIHEFAHAIEDQNGYYIYNDLTIENEFLNKRNKLKLILSLDDYDIRSLNFSNTKYDKNFDQFMYGKVGDKKINTMVTGLFLRGYSVISLREYFATGFEEFYLGDKNYLKKLCPSLYEKLILINENEMEMKKDEF
tara:strand:- start:707 stop:1405 length:699 start_codon:yes stop_codon:yes gene_type:complete